jgi:hypothetical protein
MWLMATDEQGRIIVNSPEELLQQFAENDQLNRRVATLSYSMRKKHHAIAELEHTLNECRRAVIAMRAAHHSDRATGWRKAEEFLVALRDEMQMWLHLDERRYHAAWDSLVEAQEAAHRAARWLPDFEPAQRLEEHLAEVERIVFPKQHYFSPSMIVDESSVECSICHTRGGECDHIAGDIYDGEAAHRIIHNIVAAREVSMVESPASKRARAISFSGMDPLTGEASESLETTPSADNQSGAK